jgi:hypothetical protein
MIDEPGLKDGLSLEVGYGWARVGLDEVSWPRLSGPILLAVAQCWRFLEVERRLDDLSVWMIAGRVRPRKALDDRMRDLRAPVLGLPCVEGPLVDPRGNFPTRRPALIDRTIARRLGLGPWRDRIGERVEIVEATLAALVEDRRHLDSVAWAIALEALILLALLADTGPPGGHRPEPLRGLPLGVSPVRRRCDRGRRTGQ